MAWIYSSEEIQANPGIEKTEQKLCLCSCVVRTGTFTYVCSHGNQVSFQPLLYDTL